MKIVALLNRVYTGQLPLLHDEQEYLIAMEESEQQFIAGQVYYELKEHNFLAQVPPFFTASLLEKREAQSLINMILKAEADRIVSLFDRHGIRTIVLKGIWLSRRLYGNIGIRATSDIDLLVKPEDMPVACDLISGMAYERMPPDPNSPYHTEFVKEMPNGKSDFHIELHWSLLKPDYYRLDCRPFWDRALPIQPYEYVYELSVPDLFYSLCLHGARHGMSSVKNAIDIVAMVQLFGDQIDYGPLLERAYAEHTYGLVVMSLSVVYRLFPHLHSFKPFEACRIWFPWNQQLAWKRESGYKRLRAGLPYYLQRTIFELAKFDRNRYRFRYLRRLFFPKRVQNG